MSTQRTIKFRAWDTIANKWLWMGFERFTSETHSDQPIEKRMGRFWLTPEWIEDSGRIIFMAFTGLTDCKGVEVYEGDIVQVKIGGKNHAKLIIKYLGRSFVMGHPRDDNEMDCVWYYDFKVVGNIYENPELLKTKTPTP